MMSSWALRFRRDDLEPLAALWQVHGVEATHQDECIWLRGRELDEPTRLLLPKIASEARFDILEGGALVQFGHRVPRGYLPPGPWRPLRQFLTIALPPASISARHFAKINMALVPSSNVSDPNVLLTDLPTWYHYGLQAPEIRLRRCQFAVCRDGRVLIHGTPLPPLSGVRAVARAGLVVPCGWTWSPAVDADLLARSWDINLGDLWLFWPGRLLEQVRAEQLVSANYSALRATWEAFSNDRTH